MPHGGKPTTRDSRSTPKPFVGPWVVLFPATYLAYIAEEYWGGFPGRTAELTRLAIPDGAFLGANALFWALMTIAVFLVLRRPTRALLVVALATILAINAALHIGGTLLSASYSPGLVSALLLWLLLGVAALVRGRRSLSKRDFRAGLLIGVAIHAAVPLVLVAFVLLLGEHWRAA